MDGIVIVMEILVIIAVAISLGPALQGWLNAWGLLLLVVIGLGMIAPLVLSWRRRRVPRASVATAAILVLVGGFLLRVVVIFSSEMI